MERPRLVTIGLATGGLIFTVAVVVLGVAVVRGWALANELVNPTAETAEAGPEAQGWPDAVDADDEASDTREDSGATLLVSRALHLAAVLRPWSTEARLLCKGPGCKTDVAKPVAIAVKPGMAVKWDLDWSAGESTDWTERLATDLIAGRPDALDDMKLRFAQSPDVAELGRPKHRVVEFWDPRRERAGLWAVVSESKAKVVALAWLDAEGSRTRWVLELET